MNKKLFIGILVLGCLSAGLRHFPFRLDYNDQAKQAYVSYEMVTAGHLLYQRSPDGTRATKPPLCGWLSAAVYELTRSWTVAWRLPSLLAGLALLILLFRTASPLGALPAMLAAAAFLLNHQTQRLLIMVRTDMVLALSIFIPVAMIYRRLREGQPWTRRDTWIFGVLLGLGLLAKGPVNYVFLLPGLLMLRILQRKEPAPWRGPGPIVFLIPFLIFALWALAGALWVPDFYDQVVRAEFGSRFTPRIGGGGALFKGAFYYIGTLVGRLAPWSFVAAGLLFIPKIREQIRRDPSILWLACALAGGLVVMTLIPSKRHDRIYPLVPILCLFCATLAAAIPSGHRAALWMKKGLLPLMAALLVAHMAYSIRGVKKALPLLDSRPILQGFQDPLFSPHGPGPD